MNPIAELRDKLIDLPDIRFMAEADALMVFPADDTGFAVSIRKEGEEFEVAFSGWRARFTEPQEAFNCMTFGLSDDCRLRVESRGGRECRWTVEALENGVWRDHSSTGTTVLAFWKPIETTHLQNRFLSAE